MLDIEMLSHRGDQDNPVSEKIGPIPSGRYGRHTPGVVTPPDLEQLKKDDHAYRALWSSVILQAIKDLFCMGTTQAPSIKDDRTIGRMRAASAKDWFESDNKDQCSFRWVCDFLGFSPGAIRSALKASDSNYVGPRAHIRYVLNKREIRRH